MTPADKPKRPAMQSIPLPDGAIAWTRDGVDWFRLEPHPSGGVRMTRMDAPTIAEPVSETPQTDALVEEGGMRDDADFARRLERERNAAIVEVARLKPMPKGAARSAFQNNELALLRFMHALIGQTIAEVEADADHMPVMGCIHNRPASGRGRVVGFAAVLRAPDEGGNRFPIELTVEEIPAFLLRSEDPMLSETR